MFFLKAMPILFFVVATSLLLIPFSFNLIAVILPVFKVHSKLKHARSWFHLLLSDQAVCIEFTHDGDVLGAFTEQAVHNIINFKRVVYCRIQIC